MVIRHAWIAVSSFVLACSDAKALDEPDAESRQGPLGKSVFVDARSFFSEPDDLDAWYALMIRLKADFDSVCGDTFCEGDFSNYESLGFRCSVHQRNGRIGRCVWIFAASNENVMPGTGDIQVEAKTWGCNLPVAAGTPIVQWFRALSAADEAPLFARLPGAQQSLYDGLSQCL